ncbi:MAG: NADH dehydrogenase (quinone) subunit D [Acidobacteriaceae bacterium]|nr:NADH dehydrogenase (quinone) subunit D [Acidobacteriaceae bacterium]MBV9500419.1 NADH dehydrogenase (quinone) subunit D [Acidobacteriaceae bacterium]
MREGYDHVASLDAEHELAIEDPSGLEYKGSQPGSGRRMTLNMGPQHPSTHGVLRVVLELDGETILSARPEIGYLHTGIEKQCEAKKYQQVVPLTDRVDYLANLNNNLCYALAVEKLLGLEIPEMAQWMRVLLCELTRVASHLIWLGTHALDIGAMTVYFYCFREREEILKIFEMFSGQRMMTSYIRPGGLALEPPRGWHKAITRVVERLQSGVDEYQELLAGNPIWVNRTKGVGMLPVDIMIDLGVTGPMLRAAGVNIDARKDSPHSSYDKFQFDVPTRTANDVYARFEVRMEEMRQSIRMVRQALDGMPSGPWHADAPHILLPDREKMKTQMEALIYHFKIVTEGYRVPAGSVYQVVESPRGELGYYVVSDGTANPHRVFMRTPSFGNLQSLGAMLEGVLIADSIAVMGSMDFVLGDVDR